MRGRETDSWGVLAGDRSEKRGRDMDVGKCRAAKAWGGSGWWEGCSRKNGWVAGPVSRPRAMV